MWLDGRRGVPVLATCLLLFSCGGGSSESASPGASVESDATGADTGTSVTADGGAPAVDSRSRGDTGPSSPIARDIAATSSALGSPCLDNRDCAGGWCVEGPDGFVCTRTCVEDCPAGWACKVISPGAGSDPVPLCIPLEARVCAACAHPVDCGGIPLCALPSDEAAPGDGGLCFLRCDDLDAPCPEGFVCRIRVTLPLVDPAFVCVPEHGFGCCAESTRDASEPCARENDHGTCRGERTCRGRDGWGSCSAPEPNAEQCNAADDDCDGTSDEDLPGCACGDGRCDSAAGETAEICPCDCGACGDGFCSPCSENPSACPEDCCRSPEGTAGCGDGWCLGFGCGENPTTCPEDCGTACGNGVCDRGESPESCAEDCAHKVCGNGVCEASDGGPEACPQDCDTACGDCRCEGRETAFDCPLDCGYCGDGQCSPCAQLGETKETCPKDCCTPAQEY